MKGLDLCEEFYTRIVKNQLPVSFPALSERVAVGLVGNGSECFGYDDLDSQDHDWGAELFFWLEESDRAHIPKLNAWQDFLLELTPIYPRRKVTQHGAYVGAITVGNFFESLIGFPEGPQTIEQWRSVPQENLAMAVNGRVFYDPTGHFTAIRQRLLQYYPEDYRRKKIAARCMAIAQTGQYNLPRFEKRGMLVEYQLTQARFVIECMALTFLLNRSYTKI